MNLTVTPYRNNINVAFASKTGHTNPQRTVSPNVPKDYIATPDAFEKETFNVDIALGQLKNIKDEKSGNQKEKFSVKNIAIMKSILTDAPEKWNSIHALAKKDNISGNSVVTFAMQNTEKLDTIKDYSDVKNAQDKPRYSESQLLLFNRKADAKTLKHTKPLTKTSLSPENIVAMAGFKSDFLEKAANRVAEVEKETCNNNPKQIIFTCDHSDRQAFNIIAQDNKGTVHTALVDKNMNKEAIETAEVYRTKKGNIYQIKKVKDLRNNTISKVRLQADENGYPVVTHEVRVIKDKNNKIARTEYTAPSEIPGIFDIKYQYPNGKEEIVSSGKFDKKTGITSIKKNMVSLDGTRTDYLYENDESGNRISDYKITDKNGKVLLKKSSTFEVVAPNKIISSNNDDKYEITLSDKTIDVKDLKRPEREVVTLDIDKKIQGNKKKILASLKEMPGEELIKVAQSTKTLVGIDSPLESYYAPADKSIHSGDQLFVVLHELGHARDMRDVNLNSSLKLNETIGKAIFADEKLNKTFEEEKKNFNKAFPDAQRDHIDYFINTLNHYGGEVGGLRETIAESNALLTTPKTMELLAIRSQYLQQYFPRTIAHLSETLNKEAV